MEICPVCPGPRFFQSIRPAEYFRSKMSKFLRPPSAVFRFCIITHVRQLCINVVDSPKKAKSHASLAVAMPGFFVQVKL